MQAVIFTLCDAPTLSPQWVGLGLNPDSEMRRSEFIFASAILMPPNFRLPVFAASDPPYVFAVHGIS
jgi:hypothetical protein